MCPQTDLLSQIVPVKSAASRHNYTFSQLREIAGHVKEEPIDLSDDGNSPDLGMPALHVQAQPAAPAKQLSAPVLIVASEVGFLHLSPI